VAAETPDPIGVHERLTDERSDRLDARDDVPFLRESARPRGEQGQLARVNPHLAELLSQELHLPEGRMHRARKIQ
jgi:hypothetical protein